MPHRLLVAALAFALAACAGSPPSRSDAPDRDASVAGLTDAQVADLLDLGVPVLVPTRIGAFAVDGFQASRTDYGAGYSIAYRRADGACFEINGTNEGLGGPGYPIVQMDVTILALGRPSRIYKASDDPDATSAQNWGPGTVISEHVEVEGMAVTFLSASVSGCRPLSIEEAGPIFASLAPVNAPTGVLSNSSSGGNSDTWADATDVLDVIGGVAGEDPETAAFAAFSTDEEGTRVLVETLRQADGSATVLVTMLGLADDSVRDERFRIEYEEGEQEYWRAVAAQRQVRCWPGRGHQDWGPSACQ